jgi:hypothetical protein
MPGAYRVALSRATVEQLDPDGNTTATHKGVTFTVRDGVAQFRTGAAPVAAMDLEQLIPTGRNRYTVVGPDGTRWLVSRPCGCAGGR